MSEKNVKSTTNTQEINRFLPVLLLLFIGSGCAALVYEIVWFQMLGLVIGSTGISLGVLLGTFMGGMCLGSLLLPRYVSTKHHPLKVYAYLEIGIGVIGLLQLIAIPALGHVYSSIAGYGLMGILLRGFVCSLLLLPPTILMGATLPAISRWIETTPKGVSWMGFFYGGNIVGAVLGCLLAGFYLLRVFDIITATIVAAAINMTVAATGFGLAKLAPGSGITDEKIFKKASNKPGIRLVHVAIGLSGFCGLGAEVVWTRILSLILGGTVYTFSIILAVFLTGLGIGSSIASFLLRSIKNPRIAFGFCQLFLVAAIAWAAYMLGSSIPYWPVSPDISKSPWFNFQIDLVRCIWAILPSAILWGASFPLALAAVAEKGQDPARLVGGVYAANTFGAIIGAIVFSMVMIPWIGSHQAQRLLIIISLLSAMLMLSPLLYKISSTVKQTRRRLAPSGIVTLSGSVVVAALLAWSIPGIPPALIAYGRHMLTWSEDAKYVYVGEGMNASIAVSEMSNGVRNFHVSGKVEASSEPQDMRLQRMLGHISALFHEQPKSVLVVGFGAGITAGSFVLHPDVERIVICEIEPLIPAVTSRFFAYENYDILNDPRVEMIYDDARHFILTTDEKFDVITSDPIHPWVKGAATLYTKEYFEHVKERLNPGGVITQWVPLYESTADVVKSEVATFFEVFPEGTLWGNDISGSGYDVIMVGKKGDTTLDVDKLLERMVDSDHFSVAESLGEVGFYSLFDLLATYAGRGPDLSEWLKDAQINRDRNLRLQYLAGMGVDNYLGTEIYNQMLNYRKFPDDFFTGSEQVLQALRETLNLR